MSTRIFRIKPLEYYKLRSSGKYPAIINLTDECGEDRRYPDKVNETYLYSKYIIEYEEGVKEFVSNGEKLVALAKKVQEEENSFIQEKYLEKWEIISGLKQITNWHGAKRPIYKSNYED